MSDGGVAGAGAGSGGAGAGAGGLGAGWGGAISGGIQALGTVYAAYMAKQQAEEDREQAKKKHNVDTKLQLAQFNMNQDRLAGLAGVASGEEAYQQDQANTNFMTTYDTGNTGDLDAVKALNKAAYHTSITGANEAANAVYKGKSDYKNLNANKYTL